jgi:hypothetical protein
VLQSANELPKIAEAKSEEDLESEHLFSVLVRELRLDGVLGIPLRLRQVPKLLSLLPSDWGNRPTIVLR